MAVTLNLPSEVEQRLKETASRIGLSLEEYLQQIATREAAEHSIAYPPLTPAERAKALREWAENQPRVDHFVDDSRESSYSGRGE